MPAWLVFNIPQRETKILYAALRGYKLLRTLIHLMNSHTLLKFVYTYFPRCRLLTDVETATNCRTSFSSSVLCRTVVRNHPVIIPLFNTDSIVYRDSTYILRCFTSLSNINPGRSLQSLQIYLCCNRITLYITICGSHNIGRFRTFFLQFLHCPSHSNHQAVPLRNSDHQNSI